MKCKSCGQENAQGAKFCSNCGGALDTVCPGCGLKNAEGARFCNGCGKELIKKPQSSFPTLAAMPKTNTPQMWYLICGGLLVLLQFVKWISIQIEEFSPFGLVKSMGELGDWIEYMGGDSGPITMLVIAILILFAVAICAGITGIYRATKQRWNESESALTAASWATILEWGLLFVTALVINGQFSEETYGAFGSVVELTGMAHLAAVCAAAFLFVGRAKIRSLIPREKKPSIIKPDVNAGPRKTIGWRCKHCGKFNYRDMTQCETCRRIRENETP